MASRRFSQAISEGDGISVIVEVGDADEARAAETQGAEAVVLVTRIADVRGATSLPICWHGGGSLDEAAALGADACVLSMRVFSDDDGELERLHGQAQGLGLDCVVEVRDEDELRLALERVDPEILLLAPNGESDGGLDRALALLPDVPAGKLAVAEVPLSSRAQVEELERAGVDAVIVGARDVAGLTGDGSPER